MNWRNEPGPRDTTVKQRTVFDAGCGPPPSVIVATALADLDDDPAWQTDFTLADTIDPDALDDLVTATRGVRVSFPIQQSLVVVQGDGRIEIRQRHE